jgi:hypothetical protein
VNIGFGFLIRISMATTIRQAFPAASAFDPRGVKESGRLGKAKSGGQKPAAQYKLPVFIWGQAGYNRTKF